MEEYLVHYGILGMKWGIRRTPEQLGHRKSTKIQKPDHTQPTRSGVPQGAKLYRTTVKRDDYGSDGTIYVTYDKRDRNFYKYDYAKNLSKHQGGKKTYENTYTTNKDLKIASYKEVDDTVRKLTKGNAKASSDAAKTFVEYKYGIPISKVKELSTFELGKRYADNMMNDYNTAKEITYKGESTFFSAGSLGGNSKLKNAVVSELKKQGYQGMTDKAGVGFLETENGKTRGTEGNDPLIIFDPETNLSQVSSKSYVSGDVRRAAKKLGSFTVRSVAATALVNTGMYALSALL